MQLDFSNKTVLVTGATRGIGAAIAQDFNRCGAKLILTGTKVDQIAELNRENKDKGITNIEFRQVDLGDRNSVDAFLAGIEAEERIDVCVNNAGINRLNPIDKILTEDLDAMTEINLRAPFLICRTVSKLMKRANHGRIVNIASIWSVVTKSGRSVYSASKFGLVGMTKTLAADLGPNNILVNAVSPGFTLTELTQTNMPAEEQKRIAEQVPLKRFAQPEEIAKAVLFLASDMNTYITGQNIVVDGGFVSV